MTKRRSKALEKPPKAALGLDLQEVVARLRAGRRLRRSLQPWGRLYVDRPLPFLCIYRRPPGSADPLSESLITSQAAYLLAPGDASTARGVAQILHALASVLTDDFGACLFIEVSLAQRGGRSPGAPEPPLFQITARRNGAPAHVIAELETALSRIAIDGATTSVGVLRRAKGAPPGMTPILGRKALPNGCFVLNLEIQPVYFGARKGRRFPIVGRRLRKDLSGALKRTAFEFTTHHTTQRPRHYHALGRGKFLKAVWDSDQRLADVSNRFDFLLLSTPRNTREAWAEFRRRHFSRRPHFSYPPLPFDPDLAKRELYRIPIERIEDPTLEELFSEQRAELERKINMLADRDTFRFKYGSLQLFGKVEDELLAQAQALLDRIPPRSRERAVGPPLNARALAKRAEEEFRYLQQGSQELPARVRVLADVSGVMVSRGNLLVPSRASIAAARVEALLQHEIGTHIVTYYNGAAQPFRQLRNGLPGYEELQEGLAVLAEYLVGGLSRARLRILAARVVAVRRMIDGASFVEVFRELTRSYEFAQRTAYTIAMRVFRGGGQVKDAVYLRGLVSLLQHLGTGESLEPLLVGKFGLQHLEVVKDLGWRHVLAPPRFRPRYLDMPEARTRLENLRRGVQIIDLLKSQPRRRR